MRESNKVIFVTSAWTTLLYEMEVANKESTCLDVLCIAGTKTSKIINNQIEATKGIMNQLIKSDCNPADHFQNNFINILCHPLNTNSQIIS